MSDSLLSSPDWTPTLALLVDQACDRFESAWQSAAASGQRPRIEDYLTPTPEPGHSVLLRELLTVELAYRRRNGDQPAIEEYRSRFPQYSALLDEVFSSQPEPGEAAPPAESSQLRTKVLSVRPETPESPPDPFVFSGEAESAAPRPAGLPVIANHEILGELGRGGMGVVFKARQRGLNRVVALKMIRSGVYANSEELARFQSEAEAVAQLKHANIVPIYEIGEHEDEPYFSLEFVEGGSLEKKLAHAPQPPREAAALVEVLARAMHHAHQHHIIHRDLKPANVLLTPDGTPKITDFGLAKQLDVAGKTREGVPVGTPSYMAPEQAAGRSQAIGPATDVYALGAILYEMLTGRPPFKGDDFFRILAQVLDTPPEPPRRRVPTVPRDLETICLKCLEKEPRRRYPSARALAEDLRRFQAGEPIRARRVGPMERGIKWARRHPAATLAGVFLVLSLVGYVLFLQTKLASLSHTKTVREQATTAYSDADQLFAAGNYGDALTGSERVLALLSTAPFPELEEQASHLRDRARDRLNERQQQAAADTFYNEVTDLLGDKIKHDSHVAGLSIQDDVIRVRAPAPAALDLFGPRAAALLHGPHLTAEQKQEIVNGRYEFVLVRANALMHVLPGEDPATQARLALEVLREAEPLRSLTRAYYLQMAQYLDQMHDPQAAQKARDRADGPGVTRDSATDQFLLGNQSYQARNWSEAIGHFGNALRQQANHFWAQYLTAICYLQQQQPAEALANLNACMARRPDFLWVHLLRSLANGELAEQQLHGRPPAPKLAETLFQAAEADFRKAMELKPDEEARYVLLVNRAVLRIRQQKWSEAEADLQQAIGLKKDHFLAHINLATAYEKQGRLAEAIAALNTAIACQPQAALLYRQRSQLYRQRADYGVALGDIDRAIGLQPPPGRARLAAEARELAEDQVARGRLLNRMDRLDEALRACDAALALLPDFGKAHRLRAEVFLEQQRYRESIRAFDAYLHHAPASAEVFEARGLAKMKQHDYAGAIHDYTQGLALEPKLPLRYALHAHRGWAYLLGGDSPRLALPDFEAALQLDPAPAEAYAGRGSARVWLGDYLKGVADAETAVQRAADDYRIQYNAARIYAQAMAKVEADKAVMQERKRRELSQQYEVRALGLLRRALDLVPPGQRVRFWQEQAQKDPALDPVRRRDGFRQLAAANAARIAK